MPRSTTLAPAEVCRKILMKKLLTVLACCSLFSVANAENWQAYAQDTGVNELDTESVETAAGLRYYRIRAGYDASNLTEYSGVVNCARKLRGDSADNLREIYPNTKYAEELLIACGARAKAVARAPAKAIVTASSNAVETAPARPVAALELSSPPITNFNSQWTL